MKIATVSQIIPLVGITSEGGSHPDILATEIKTETVVIIACLLLWSTEVARDTKTIELKLISVEQEKKTSFRGTVKGIDN